MIERPQFSPGPWGKDILDCRVWSQDGRLVALPMGAGVFSEAQILANAQLIAVAPEMYEALHNLHRWMNCACKYAPGKHAPVNCGMCGIRALLAKARGERP